MKARAPRDDDAIESSAVNGSVRELVARTIEVLDTRGVADEALGVMRPAHRILGLMRPAVIVPVGRAWRLGVLLIDRDGALYATGAVTRAITPKRGVANHSLAADARRELQRAAVRGSFAHGEVVNFGYSAISLDVVGPQEDAGPLSMDGTIVVVRWDTTDAGRASAPLETYLAERLSLLTVD
ncbi:MAG: glutaminase [Terrimesophilobacter sp.]